MDQIHLDPRSLKEAARYEQGISRRLFLAFTSALATIPQWQSRAIAGPTPSFSTNPFTLGVASGDPDAQGFVLWTRLAPEPLTPYGGVAPVVIGVDWQVAEDEGFQQVVAFGSEPATPQLGHSVHVEVNGLAPDRWYWYRFRVGDFESPRGRARTLPLRSANPAELRFAFTSCQHYEQGLYTGYQQMVRDQLDLVVHLGDYIYENGGRDGLVRKHVGAEIRSLTDYRVRYAQYRSDPLLQQAHAACPWLVTWDDHEFDNNYAADRSEEAHVNPVEFLIRRAAAYQAYYEAMPLRRQSIPQGPHMQLYRSASFGRLAEFLVLDTRQYRTDQPNDDRESPLNDAAMNRQNSLLGTPQREWLFRQLIGSQGHWNILAQQVMMGMVGGVRNGESLAYSMDQWPGCTWERMELMRFLAERRVPNPVVLTGDIHSNWVNDLRVDDRVESTPLVATEFVCTSLSSGGNGVDQSKDVGVLTANNPCVRYHNRERGYVRCRVTPDVWESDYVVVEDVVKPDGPIVTRASFVVEAGRAGATRTGA